MCGDFKKGKEEEEQIAGGVAAPLPPWTPQPLAAQDTTGLYILLFLFLPLFKNTAHTLTPQHAIFILGLPLHYLLFLFLPLFKNTAHTLTPQHAIFILGLPLHYLLFLFLPLFKNTAHTLTPQHAIFILGLPLHYLLFLFLPLFKNTAHTLTPQHAIFILGLPLLYYFASAQQPHLAHKLATHLHLLSPFTIHIKVPTVGQSGTIHNGALHTLWLEEQREQMDGRVLVQEGSAVHHDSQPPAPRRADGEDRPVPVVEVEEADAARRAVKVDHGPVHKGRRPVRHDRQQYARD